MTVPDTLAFRLNPKMQSLPRTREVFEKMLAMQEFIIKLPKADALAGQVIRHGVNVIEETLRLHGPMVYKIGFSYNPYNRWHNKSFGYKYEKQRWQHMTIIYISSETMGPAFLEAALIQRFKGPSLQFHHMQVASSRSTVWFLL